MPGLVPLLARNGDNGASIRVTGGNFVTVRNCKITACDMGIMSDHNDHLLTGVSLKNEIPINNWMRQPLGRTS